MKDFGGERMHYPFGECILSPSDFDVGSECWDSWKHFVQKNHMLQVGAINVCIDLGGG